MAREGSPALQALSIALNHPVVSSNARNICSLAQVCKSWSQAVQQQAAGGNTSIVIQHESSLETIASFASWLPKHAGHVSSITAKVSNLPISSRADKIGGVPCKIHIAAARQLLQQSLQLAGAAMTEPTTTSSSSSSRALQLRSFSSDYLCTTGILSCLPASLTQLSVAYEYEDKFNGPGVVAALARLTGLQQLRLSAEYNQQPPVTYLSGLAQLTRLTQLDMHIDLGKGVVLLESMPSLQQLQLKICCSNHLGEGVMLDLSRLSGLETLELYLDDYGSPSPFLVQGSSLPAQLKQLYLGGFYEADVASVLNITTLNQLQQLTVLVTHTDSSALESLARLPQLQQLALHYDFVWPAAATAASWTRLPQLCSLEVTYQYDSELTVEELEAIGVGLAAATNLTKLCFEANNINAEGGKFYGEFVFGYISGLTNLKDLIITNPLKMAEKAAMALTALTGLTSLSLVYGGDAVDDVVATALACNLTGLVSLRLTACELNYGACLAAIARLTGLTELDLSSSSVSREEGLMMLTSLTNLQHLATWEPMSADVVDRFWAAMRRQQLTGQQQH